MLFTAKCYWPGVESELRAAIGSLADSEDTVCRGALHLPGDALVLCVFESSSRAAVKRACEHAGLPCERLIETVLVPPASRTHCELS